MLDKSRRAGGTGYAKRRNAQGLLNIFELEAVLGLPQSGGKPGPHELLEVLDASGRPLIVMPQKDAVRQSLRRRAVLVALRNTEGRVYIHKRSSNKFPFPGCWNISASGHVNAGETPEEAAHRDLKEELGVSVAALDLKAVLSEDALGIEAWLFASTPAAVMPRADSKEIELGFFMDEDELVALFKDMPELFTPSLAWAARTGELFRADAGRG